MGTIYQQVLVLGTKGKKKVKALVDSGAETSFITKKLAEHLGIIGIVNTNAYLGDGSKISNAKMASCLISIKGLNFSLSVVIVDDLGKDDLVIGVDFLQEHDYILLFKNDSLKFKKRVSHKGYRL